MDVSLESDGPGEDLGPEVIVGMVVVNYGSHALLEHNLGMLDLPWLRIIVVDNFSSAAEQALVGRLGRERGWEMVFSPTNSGYGDGNNLGLARALELGCQAVVLVNPDARLLPADLRRLVQLSLSNRRSLISPVINRPDGSIWFSGSSVSRSGRVARVSGEFVSGPDTWLSGAVLAAHRDLWRELGGFAPGYFLYWEDVDISRRCVELGGTLVVAADVHAVHDAGGTQLGSPGRKSALYYRYNCRNRLLFAARHLQPAEILRWVLHTPRESLRVVRRGGRRQFLTAPWVLLPALRGTIEGLVFVGRRLAGRPL